MSLASWLVVGLVAGALARAATGAPRRGCLGTVVIGILGALLGGAAFRLASGDDLGAFDELDLTSVFVAFVGASAVLLVLEAARPGGRGPLRRRRRRT